MEELMKKKIISLLLLSTFLVGCGGGGKKPEPKPTPTPTPSVSPSKEVHEIKDLPDLGDAPTYEEDSIQFHYWRTDGKYAAWNMWLWEKGYDGAQFDWNGKDDWGVIASYPLSTWKDPLANSLGFLVRKGNWEAKDLGGNDMFVEFAAYDKDANGVYHIYMIFLL